MKQKHIKYTIIGMVGFFLILFLFVHAATPPTLVGSTNYSILGATTVTNTGATTTTGEVGVSTGTAITGFPLGVAGGNNAIHLHSNDSSAIAAQADNLTAFGTLDQGCTTTYSGTKDLVGLNLVPGVYCADSFHLTGTLTLSGSGVWIFKSASDLITSGTANVVGDDPCNVWWRVVSSATLGTNTSLIGNILAQTSIWMNTGATLQGRALAYTGEVTLDTNTITECSAPIPTPSTPPTPPTTSGSSGSYPHYGCKDTNALNYEYFAANDSSLCKYAITTSCIPLTNFQVKSKISGDNQDELYWKGIDENANVTIFIDDSISVKSYIVKNTGYYEAKNLTNGVAHWFWITNDCSTTIKIDPLP